MAANSQSAPADPNSINLDGMSFREKQKYFEKEIREHSVAQPAKPTSKHFSYLAEHEIAKMKQEEAKKTANMSQEQLRSYVASGVADIKPDHDLDHMLSSLNTRSTMSGSGVVRTLKAEKRLQIYNFSENNNSETSVTDDQQISSLDPREVEAEKRAAWRKARMKSLEADALQAQAVIAKAQEMSREPVHRSDNTAASSFSTVDIAFADEDDSHQNHNGNSQVH